MTSFGPSGNSKRFFDEGYKTTAEAVKWCASQGLTAYEYSFGRGINVSDQTAQQIAAVAAEVGVKVSVHAPYYINFANPSDDMAAKSYDYVLRSAHKVKCFGGNRVVFHPSTVGKMQRDEAVALTHTRLQILADAIRVSHMDDIWYCPETMGKINQIGDVAEVTSFCRIADFYLPTIDFGHINARTHGSLKTEEDYDLLVRHVIDNLGYERASKMHIHFSKIEYSAGGEVKHLTFEDTVFGPEFFPLAKVLVKHKLQPTVICESDGTQADDALTMKCLYEKALQEG